MNDKYELKDLQLYKEDGCYYLMAVYHHENEKGIYEVIIPKIRLFIRKEPSMKIPLQRYGRYAETPTIDLGFGDCAILSDADGAMYMEKLIEEKIHDVTLNEIEKKLGFKVRVVSEKEKEK